jgi:hypothetical protein
MICSRCGSEIFGNFCSNCGKPVDRQLPNKPKSRIGWVWLSIMGVFLIVIIMVSVMNHDSDESSSKVSPAVQVQPQASQVQSPAAQVKSPTVKPTGNIAHDQLISFPPEVQMFALSRVLTDEHCNANRVYYQGMSKDHTAFWSVGCANGRSYEVSIYADKKGSTKVLDCATLKAVAGTNCFEKFKN